MVGDDTGKMEDLPSRPARAGEGGGEDVESPRRAQPPRTNLDEDATASVAEGGGANAVASDARRSAATAAFALGPLVAGSTLPEATVRGEEEDEEGDDD